MIIDKNLATNYDSTKTYAIDDIVLYKEKMYRCTTAVETAEEFDSSKWNRCYLVDRIKGNNSNTDDVIVYMNIAGANINWKLLTTITVAGEEYKATQIKCVSENYVIINNTTTLNQDETLSIDANSVTEIGAKSQGASYSTTIEITYSK